MHFISKFQETGKYYVHLKIKTNKNSDNKLEE